MEQFRMTLAFEGIDFEDDEIIDRLAEAVPDVHWMSADGEVRALLYVEAQTGRAAARTAVAAIRQVVPAARATRVVEDFVAIPDIAERAGVNRETVRTWVTGARGPRDFPRPRGVVGNGIRVWDWASVNRWLRRHYALGDEARYLTAAEVAHVNEWLITAALHTQFSETTRRPRIHQPLRGWGTAVKPASAPVATVVSSRRSLAEQRWQVAG